MPRNTGATVTFKRKDTSHNLQTYNLGVITDITFTYDADVMQSPLLIFGYSGAFTMDMGVGLNVSVSFERASPPNPQNNTNDSTRWSNAEWVRRIKMELNNWQADHNGYVLTIDPPDTDLFPYRQYTGYITGMPFQFSAGSSSVAKITGTLGFALGGLTSE